MARGRSKTEAPAALKLKTCKRKIRKDGIHVECGRQYLGEDRNCPNRDIHISTLKTGFCSNGWCEGTKAVDWKGNPVPTCKFIQTCPCLCHDSLDKLFAMTGAERIVVESSGYVKPPSEFVVPESLADDPLSMSDPMDAHRTVEDATSAPAPPPVARSYQPTPSGRTARGQLESWVLNQCTIWTVEGFEFPCTPVWISKNISHDEAIPEPSVGAISAVFDRWVKLGFAVIDKKPTRFSGFTEEGKKLGLERMKANAKRAEQLRRAEQRRGSLR